MVFSYKGQINQAVLLFDFKQTLTILDTKVDQKACFPRERVLKI